MLKGMAAAGRIATGVRALAWRRIAGLLAIIALAGGLAPVGPARAAMQDTPARSALVVDLSSGAVLMAKNADERLPPASMMKLMTLYMVFEALERGNLSLDDTFRVSANAAAMGGSKMFLRQGEVVSVENLIQGVIVQSGNDAAVALAEGLAGTEEAFAERMNQRAAEIGLTNSKFATATGWPHPDQHMTSRDLAHLATLIVREFPEYYKYFSEKEFTWADIHQYNRNPLLTLDIGADGLKTGHTQEAGYGLVASASRGDRRIVMVIQGMESEEARAREGERLINWAFRAFETRKLFAGGEKLAEAPVWIGAAPTVGLAPAQDVVLSLPYGSTDETELTISYDAPIPAPIEAGQEVGTLKIAASGLPPVSVPLVATEAVAEGGFLTRMQAAIGVLLDDLAPTRLLNG